MRCSTAWGFDRAISGEQDVLEVEKMPVAELLRVTSVYEIIARSAELSGDSPAITYLVSSETNERIELSYRQVFARLTQAANALHEIGVQPSDTVSGVRVEPVLQCE